MKWRRDARDKRHFIIMSAVAVLVLVIGLFFDHHLFEVYFQYSQCDK